LFAFGDVFGHRKILREPYQGIFHLLSSMGSLSADHHHSHRVLPADILFPITGIWFMKGNFYLIMKLFANVFGMLAIVGILMALLPQIRDEAEMA